MSARSQGAPSTLGMPKCLAFMQGSLVQLSHSSGVEMSVYNDGVEPDCCNSAMWQHPIVMISANSYDIIGE